MPQREAILALADGTIFRGRAFGAEGEAAGELVFNTSMTGYQEILTDPSYHGQLVAMTYPQIGNVGVNREDVESTRPYVRGFIVREYREAPSNWRAEQSLGAYLAHWNIPGIDGIDTRALVRHLRDHGSQEAVLSSVDLDPERLVRKAKDTPSLVGRNLVQEVTCSEPYAWEQGPWKPGGYLMADEIAAKLGHPPFKVVAYDFGIKWNILRNLVGVGCAVRVVPGWTPAQERATTSPGCSARCPSSASASATRSSGSRSAAAPTSSSSATTAATSRCRTSRPARSRSPRRTTASRSTSTR
jgi:carbamoyl-phosphate synthase small subunit